VNAVPRTLADGFFKTSGRLLFFSSSHLIKEVAGYGKRLPELVPEIVIERLRQKLKVG
jgi:phosphopantetheine adenylyltransferase